MVIDTGGSESASKFAAILKKRLIVIASRLLPSPHKEAPIQTPWDTLGNTEGKIEEDIETYPVTRLVVSYGLGRPFYIAGGLTTFSAKNSLSADLALNWGILHYSVVG
jgi:hypothetical protein